MTEQINQPLFSKLIQANTIEELCTLANDVARDILLSENLKVVFIAKLAGLMRANSVETGYFRVIACFEKDNIKEDPALHLSCTNLEALGGNRPPVWDMGNDDDTIGTIKSIFQESKPIEQFFEAVITRLKKDETLQLRFGFRNKLKEA